MFDRFCVSVLVLIGLLLPIAGCNTSDGLDSIQVAPAAASLVVGGPPLQMTATGVYGNGSHPSTKDITGLAIWSSAIPGVATVNAAGVVTAVGAGVTTITATATGFSGPTSASATITVSANAVASTEPLASLAVIPGAQTALAVNQTAQFNAIATTGTGTTVNLTNQSAKIGSVTVKAAVWSSSSPAVASIDPASGLATALSAGTTTITAVATNPDGTVVTGSATFTVTVSSSAEPLVSLAIVPSAQTLTIANQSANLIAIGTTGSGATVNLTGVPATIGSATIKAAAWTSSAPSVATINSATGVAAAVANGTTTITAVAVNPDGTVVTGTATLTVNVTGTAEPLVSLAIVPGSQSVASAGQTAQFLAIGTFSASSSTPGTQNMASVSGYTMAWYSSNPSVASITNSGTVTSVGQGTTAITAIATNNTDKSSLLATATFTVLGPSTQEITSLSIIPSTQTITLPLVTPTVPTTFFVAIGVNGTSGLAQNETTSVAWTSSNTAVAKIDGTTGGVTPVGQGTTTITAQYTNPATGSTPENVVSATATLTVSGVASEPLLSIAILPGTQSVGFPGQTSQLIAIGTFSSVPVTQNLMTSATYRLTWTSSNTAVATVGSPEQAGTTPGLVTAVGQGTAAITAIATNPDKSVVTGVASFTVTNGSAEQLTALSIIPGSLSLGSTGQPGQFIALGTSGTTGLQQDVTRSAQLAWSSSIPTIATICTQAVGTTPAYCPSTPGLAQGVSAGTTNITAEWTNPATSTSPATVVTATASVAVTNTPAAEPLLSITVIPSSITDLDLLGTAQYLAYGTFSTSPTILEITNGFSHVGFPPSCTSTALPSTCPWQQVTWVSDAQEIFPIDSAGAPGATGGLATAEGSGTDDIYAVATNPDGTLVYSPIVTFNCPYAPPTYATITTTVNGVTTTSTDFTHLLNTGTCNTLTIGDALLSTLTVFNTGLNQTNWLITAPSATGTPDVIHCGGTTVQGTPGGSVCTATYPNGTPVTLTAPAEPGVNFGGWSSTCETIAPNPSSQTGPNTCTVMVGGGCVLNQTTGTYTCSAQSNVSVGAVFN
jgi:uncharacterized protein YjdB